MKPSDLPFTTGSAESFRPSDGGGHDGRWNRSRRDPWVWASPPVTRGGRSGSLPAPTPRRRSLRRCPTYKDTADKKAYSWLGGKAQLLLCRVTAPKPDFSWTLRKIREETKDANQLGFTDCHLRVGARLEPEGGGGRLLLGPGSPARRPSSGSRKSSTSRMPRSRRPKRRRTSPKRRSGSRLSGPAGTSSSRTSWHTSTRPGTRSARSRSVGRRSSGRSPRTRRSPTKHIGGRDRPRAHTNAPTKILAAATKWDSDDLGALRAPLQRPSTSSSNSGEDGTFDYIEPKGGG